MGKYFTQIREHKTERAGQYRLTGRVFTNDYIYAYDDIGASSRLHQYKGRTRWRKREKWRKTNGKLSVRACYVINDDAGHSIVNQIESKYQNDNYVSRRAPRIGVGVTWSIGTSPKFHLNASAFSFAELFEAAMSKDKTTWNRFVESVVKIESPVNVDFRKNKKILKNKIATYDGVIGFHAAQKGGAEFRVVTRYNISSKLVVPKEHQAEFDFLVNW